MTHTTKEMKMSEHQTTTTANQTACGSKLNNSMNLEPNQGPQQDIGKALEAFRAKVEADQIARCIADKFDVDLHLPNLLAVLKIGKKYAKVDVGHSGRYMVDMETREIYGIKAYGVIHRGHHYGNLDTIEAYHWGNYTAQRLPVKGA
jgi:hypothetical protein